MNAKKHEKWPQFVEAVYRHDNAYPGTAFEKAAQEQVERLELTLMIDSRETAAMLRGMARNQINSR